MDLFSLASDIKFNSTFNVKGEFLNLITNEKEKLVLLFDTGASHTAVCKSKLIERGYTNFTSGKIKRQTANGCVKLDRCKLQDFRLSGFEVISIFEVDVVNVDFEGFQGILGMDIISKLETWISFSRKNFHLFGSYKTLVNEVLDISKNTLSASTVFCKR